MVRLPEALVVGQKGIGHTVAGPSWDQNLGKHRPTNRPMFLYSVVIIL
jgi:hypothetical protein